MDLNQSRRETARRRLAWAGILFLLVIPISCGDDDGATGPSSGPQVVGCNSVSYDGATYSNIGCAPGIASFSTTITQAGRTACFNVTCSAGCVSSVRVC